MDKRAARLSTAIRFLKSQKYNWAYYYTHVSFSQKVELKTVMHTRYNPTKLQAPTNFKPYQPTNKQSREQQQQQKKKNNTYYKYNTKYQLSQHPKEKPRKMSSFLSLSTLYLFFFFFSLSFPTLSISFSTSQSYQTFIILVDSHSKPFPFQSHKHWYSSLISPSSPSPFIHIYNTLFHGFSASLTPHQSKHLKKSHGILAVYPDSILHIHTTRSPSFLGLDRPTSPLTNLSHDGSDTIIGFLDTGIWPERRSFVDRNMGPIPTRWRGECEEGEGFVGSSCNRKLIGARFFSGGYDASPIGPINDTAEFRSPRDSNGHGTHVASVAAGSRVGGAGFRGFAKGVARGMAPKARIAIYKVCWKSGCLLSDMCKALEKAVSDGVDIVSVSLGSSSAPFYLDPFAVASFRAFQMGVLVAVSAGNEGPGPGTIVNSPPWILTVGAGTIDRDFPASVVLGDGQRVNGVSLAPETELTRLTRKPHSLFSAGKISSPSNAFSPESVRGRVVLCIVDRHVSRVALGASLKYAGAAAMILSHGDLDPKGILAEPHVIPAVAINVEEADRIDEYIKRGNNPTALILSEGKDRLDVGPAPMVASFSSRGPNRAMPAILKPDLLAPGINILGSWTDAIAPSNFAPDIQRSEFNIMSGTSMACPHVSGVAALIKSAHPEWGPSEIKSALMTTASSRTRTYPRTLIRDELTNHAASPFDIGSGHLRPDLALDPGLVYDVGLEDYVRHLCRLNYTEKEIRIVTGIRVSCRVGDEKWELNYPAFVATLEEVEEAKEVVFVRRLKMVSEVRNGVGVYRGKVVGLNGYDVWVEPKRLTFRGGFGERLGFKLGVRKGKKEGCLDKGRKGLAVGALVWREEGGKHVIRSPIVVFSKVEMFRV